MGWLRNRLNLVDASPRPTPHDDLEMSMRVEEALAASEAATKLTQAHADEARLFIGAIRREIHNAQASGEASSG